MAPRVRGFHVSDVSATSRSAEGRRIAGRSQAVLRQVLGAGQHAGDRRAEGSQDLNGVGANPDEKRRVRVVAHVALRGTSIAMYFGSGGLRKPRDPARRNGEIGIVEYLLAARNRSPARVFTGCAGQVQTKRRRSNIQGHLLRKDSGANWQRTACCTARWDLASARASKFATPLVAPSASRRPAPQVERVQFPFASIPATRSNLWSVYTPSINATT
jgi:hypothetical protein